MKFTERYIATKDGKIISRKTGKELKTAIDRNGYERLSIKYKKASFCLFVHRIIALEFLEFKGCGYVVNHKDGNKANNHVNNLEWVTVKENMRHSFHELGNNKIPYMGKTVIDLQTGVFYESGLSFAKAKCITETKLYRILKQSKIAMYV